MISLKVLMAAIRFMFLSFWDMPYQAMFFGVILIKWTYNFNREYVLKSFYYTISRLSNNI